MPRFPSRRGLPILGVCSFCALLLASGSLRAQERTAVDDAYAVCTAMESTGLITTCKVSGWGETVDVRIDTTGAEARKMCPAIVGLVGKQTRTLAGRWKLRIFSPYSGDQPIAICTFT